MVLGKGQEDGDIAHLSSDQVAKLAGNKSWQVLDAVDENEVLAEEIGEPDGLLVLITKGGGWFDVQNTATGEVINTTSLRLEDAQALIDETPDEADDE